MKLKNFNLFSIFLLKLVFFLFIFYIAIQWNIEFHANFKLQFFSFSFKKRIKRM